MIIQITNYGVEQINATKKPLVATKYKLGDAVGYVPELDQVDIKGEKLYEGQIAATEKISANVTKYRIGLDYGVGDFEIGELALFDKNDMCIAIGVESNPISKRKNGLSKGNTLVLDAYLSMVGTNYAMWLDKLSSSNAYSVPIIESVDRLEPVANAVPNFYIIKAPDREQSTILAYTSQSGLWEFNEYDYKNQIDLDILEATPTTIKIDISNWTSEQRSDLILRYFGEFILEFTSGQLYSICRYVSSSSVVGKTCTLTFKTPLGFIPQPHDKCIIWSRRVVSTSNAVLPIATRTNLGGVIVSAGLDITPMGELTANVQRVNGQVGEVVIKIDDEQLGASTVAKTGSYNDLLDKPLIPSKVGLINPIEITSGDLNAYYKAGLFFGKGSVIATVANMPKPALVEDWTLEVVPQYRENEESSFSCVQRFHTQSTLAFRAYDATNGQWSAWIECYSSANIPVASTTILGMIKVGAGLTANKDGTTSADVRTVFGKTGDVDLTRDELFAKLAPFNAKDSLPRLTKTDGVTGDDAAELDGARLPARQLTFGALYQAGTWNPQNNRVNGNPQQQLKDGGLITYNLGTEDSPSFKTWSPKGWILKVTNTGNFTLDGTTNWMAGDIIVSNGSKWELMSRDFGSVIATVKPGLLAKDGESNLTSYTLEGKTSADGKGGIEITKSEEDDKILIAIKKTGIAAGTYLNITVNELGQVVAAADEIDCGLY